MTVSSGSAWFVAQTQPHSEAKAGVHLARQGFEVYCPQYLKTVRHARRVAVVKSPLFPSYVFVWIDIESQRWRSINSTVGIVKLVGHDGVPAPLMKGVVEGLKLREGADGCFDIPAASAHFKGGEAVRVLNGAFDSCHGIFEAHTSNERVAILLELLGRKVRVVTDPEMIELA